MRTEPEGSDLRRSVAALIKQGLALGLLWVFSGLVGALPGADLGFFGLPLAVLLRFGIAVTAVVLLVRVRGPVTRTLRAALEAGLRPRAEGPALEAAAARVAANGTLLLAAVVLYGVYAGGFHPVLEAFAGLRWLLTAARLAALVVAVVALVGIFRAASPIFGKLGDDLAGRVVRPADERAPDLSDSSVPAEAPAPGKCPRCGVLNDEGSDYCRFCGRYLTPERAAAAGEAKCAACGARISLPARFCSACGAPACSTPADPPAM